MISTSGRKILMQFVSDVKTLLTNNIISSLQQHYGIWADGRVIPVSQLTTSNADIIYRARMLRGRLQYIKNSLPADSTDIDKKAVQQLTAEQAFTILNRFCAVRMCEERELIMPSIGDGYDSAGFVSYDMVTGQGSVGSRYERYCWYIQSLYDELSIELPSVFDRYSPYGLMWPDETTLTKLFDLINNENLTAFYDDQTGETVDFWREDETLGWIFQYYNSLEERRKMRDESNRPRNSREIAVRNQFFTPDYVVRFLTDNSLGRIWYEMTGGKTSITDLCQYMIHRPDEVLTPRPIKEPTELSMLDPACGSMHFGLYIFDVMEAIYMDAWDNQPELLSQYRYTETRESFARLVPKLILENNIYGAEIDPRALQIAALSLWLRAQQSWSNLGIPREERPVIERSHLVLAEPMPGNKRMLKLLTEQLDKPMQRLLIKIWDKMKYAGEAGLLIKMEQEIEAEIEDLRKNWSEVNKYVDASLFDSEEKIKEIGAVNKKLHVLINKKEAKEAFFATVVEKLQGALHTVSSRLSEEEGYENTLFANDAVRGFAFIELCQKRYDVILMNPPFGEGSESTIDYLDTHYSCWCKNLVCAFFDRMQELLVNDGLVGAIFDRTVLIKSSYEPFRKKNICGYISACADTGWNVLDANVETSTLVISKISSNKEGVFIDLLDTDNKESKLENAIKNSDSISDVYWSKSIDYSNLPNTVIGYKFDGKLLNLFNCKNIEQRGMPAQRGMALVADVHFRLFYESNKQLLNVRHIYEGSGYTLFYTQYRDFMIWERNGDIAKTYPNFRPTGIDSVGSSGLCYGKRGDILDAHILKRNLYFTVEGQTIPRLNKESSFTMLSYINSIVSQYAINQYTGQHKPSGYMNLLPMPDYADRQADIERIITEIIDIKRWWFSLDETNLEYHGLIAQIMHGHHLGESLDQLQEKLTADYTRYQELVKENDDLWMDLAEIEVDSDFRATLNAYKSCRPYEELLSIDGASNGNVINKQVMAQEIVMELVGMAFGRWNIRYAAQPETIPPFGDVFDALPFMPVVSFQSEEAQLYPLTLPTDGILIGDDQHPDSLVKRVQEVMHSLWKNDADEMESELCQLIGVDSLQTYLESPNGFFDYHFKRYTKSRRKAPIYWPVSSPEGEITLWVYYPQLSSQTLPHLLLLLSKEHTAAQSDLTAAQLANDKKREAALLNLMGDIRTLEAELQQLNDLPYKPNHDDGVPVTAAPLRNVFRHNAWKKECLSNWENLQKGEYDWSHLAYALYPARIRDKAKKDWCMALTHGLEELCENKPKEKKPRKKCSEGPTMQLFDL